MIGEYDRYNQQRMITMHRQYRRRRFRRGGKRDSMRQSSARGDAPKASRVDVRGQVPQMEATRTGLQLGLLIAIVAIVLLLTAFFQSPRVALGRALDYSCGSGGRNDFAMGDAHHIECAIVHGAIMAIGVSVANAILLVTFAETARRSGLTANEAALSGASSRLRPILMTSLAMIAGMVPIALALGEGGEQTAPLGRSVIGGLAASTIAVLTILPLTFVMVQHRAGRSTVSVHPDDVNQNDLNPTKSPDIT
jgi:multidrug efflux pump subunit AcrB